MKNILNIKPVRFYLNSILIRKQIINDNRNRQVIYIFECIKTNKIYVGSASNGSNRLNSYFYSSFLKRNLPVYKSLLFYGHDNYSLIILEDLGSSKLTNKIFLLEREQYYLDLLFNKYPNLALNISKVAGTTLGVKHSAKFSEIRSGILNPIYYLEKSEEFNYNIFRDKTGINNPQYQVIKSEITLNKLRKIVYVYDKIHIFIGEYSRVKCKTHFEMGYDTLVKYIDSNKCFKGKYFYSKKVIINEDMPINLKY